MEVREKVSKKAITRRMLWIAEGSGSTECQVICDDCRHSWSFNKDNVEDACTVHLFFVHGIDVEKLKDDPVYQEAKRTQCHPPIFDEAEKLTAVDIILGWVEEVEKAYIVYEAQCGLCEMAWAFSDEDAAINAMREHLRRMHDIEIKTDDVLEITNSN